MPRPDATTEAMIEAVLARNFEVQAALLAGQDGTTSNSMAFDPTVDAKIAAAEARTDTKFAQMEGKLDAILVEVRHSRDGTAKDYAEVRREISRVSDENVRTQATVRYSAWALAALMVGILTLLATVVPLAITWGGQHSQAAIVQAPPRIYPLINETKALPPPQNGSAPAAH